MFDNLPSVEEINRFQLEIHSLQAENEMLRSALQAIIDRDPSRPGPRAAVVVTTDTLVEIAMEALGGGE